MDSYDYSFDQGTGRFPGGLSIYRIEMLPKKWSAVLKHPSGGQEVLCSFDTPEEAATAVGSFKTGNSRWDAILSVGILSHAEVGRMSDLRNWKKIGPSN